MLKNYLLCSIILTVLLLSCGSDDDDYTPLLMETNPDTAEVAQNASVDIFIFNNDTNIPSDGALSVSTPTNGNVDILNNNTPEQLADDKLHYTPNGQFMGEDSFEYTVCLNDECVTETVTITVLPVSPVVFDLENMPYESLSEYHFFEGNMAELNPVYGVLPYKTIGSLFTDYALKKRFVWMPDGESASYVDDYSVLDFPTGTILIKNFYYENVQPENSTRNIETRLMIKKSSGWVFANYVWNNGQTQATLDGSGSYTAIEWLQNGEALSANYRIPSEGECMICHKENESPIPIGLKPQNINSAYNYSEGIMNQLAKLMEMGYLASNIPENIDTVVNWEDASEDLQTRVRSYLDINCAHCHANNAHCDYMSMRFAFSETTQDDHLGICIPPQETVGEGLSHIIRPGNIDRSAVYYRMSTAVEDERMPLLGRSIVHTEALQLMEDWINELTQDCN